MIRFDSLSMQVAREKSDETRWARRSQSLHKGLRYRRKVNLGVGDMIEVVGESLPRDDRNDLRDFTIAATDSSNSVEVFVTDPAAFLYELPSEVQHGVDLAVGRGGLTSVRQFAVAQAH